MCRALFFSLRVSAVHHPTRKGRKGVYVLALRGVTNKYALQSWRKIPPPPHVFVVGLCAHRHTILLPPLPHTDILVSLVVTALRAPDSGGAQAGGDGGSRVRLRLSPFSPFTICTRSRFEVGLPPPLCLIAPHSRSASAGRAEDAGRAVAWLMQGMPLVILRRHTIHIMCSDSDSGWGVEVVPNTSTARGCFRGGSGGADDTAAVA